MRKLFLITAIALLFATPAYSADGRGHTGVESGKTGGDGGGGGGSPPGGGSSCGCTLVQQLQERLHYHQHEFAEYGAKYSQVQINKIIYKHLPAALAAEAAGNPLPPRVDEHGNQISLGHYGPFY